MGKISYSPHLDGLRTIAITCVMVEHFGGMLPKFFYAGYYGVDLFFVISGFLITSILCRSSGSFSEAYGNFMGRRMLRIFPVYYALLAVLYAVDFVNVRENIFWLVTYTWNYAAVNQGGEQPLFYLWSLSVEEQFYVFWPFVVLAFRSSRMLLLLVTLFIVIISYWQLLFNLFPSIAIYNYTGLINRMGSLGLGAIGAIMVLDGWVPRIVLQSKVFEVCIWCLLGWALATENRYRFLSMGLCSLVLVVKANNGDYCFGVVRRLLSHPLMTSVGRFSYGIYLFHIPVGLVISYYFFDPIWLSIDFTRLGALEKFRWNSWVLKLPLYYGIVVGVAYLSYRFFEFPLLRLKDRWFPLQKSLKNEMPLTTVMAPES